MSIGNYELINRISPITPEGCVWSLKQGLPPHLSSVRISLQSESGYGHPLEADLGEKENLLKSCHQNEMEGDTGLRFNDWGGR